MIELEEKWLNACEHFGNVFKRYRHFSGGPVQALTMQIFRESQIKDGVAPVIVEGLMLEMLGHASRSLIQSPVRAGVDSVARARPSDPGRGRHVAPTG